MQVLIGVAFLVTVLVAATALWFVGKRARVAQQDKWTAEVAVFCAPLGLAPLPRGELWVPTFGCGGEVDGARVIVLMLPNRTNYPPFRPRWELLLDTGLLAGMKANVQDLGAKPTPTGPDGSTLLGYVSPAVTAAAGALQDPRLVGMALLGQGSVLDIAIRSRWPEGWNTVSVYCWLPREAKPEDARAALRQLQAVRAALAQEIP